MSDLATLLDKQAVTELCYRYAMALDDGDWDTLRTCFTPDVRAVWPDMPAFETYDDMEATCRRFDDRFTAAQHLISNVTVEIHGDEADCWSYFQTTGFRKGTPGGDTFTVGCKCRDRLVRTADGWKISERRMDLVWEDGNRAVASD